VKKKEKNSRNGCWFEGGACLKKRKLVRDDHARRVMITRESRWESQWLFFPCHADLTLFTHSQKPVLHCMRAILQEITYEKVSGSLMVEDSDLTAGDRPETLK
jgi:hypothetical protein